MSTFSPIELLGERIKLRGLEERDAQALFDLYADPQVMRYWSHAPWTAFEQAEQAIAEARSDYLAGTSLHLVIEHRTSGTLIGSCALFAFVPLHRRASVGYLLSKAHWGHGYLSEAMHAMLDFGFAELDLNRVEADVDARNTTSAKALERLSFCHEGNLRKRWIVAGELRDTACYGLLRDDWLAHRHRGCNLG
jgi:RimJ/RimL family protein N-acetyltransferase